MLPKYGYTKHPTGLMLLSASAEGPLSPYRLIYWNGTWKLSSHHTCPFASPMKAAFCIQKDSILVGLPLSGGIQRYARGPKTSTDLLYTTEKTGVRDPRVHRSPVHFFSNGCLKY
jgi:hypothetical protein